MAEPSPRSNWPPYARSLSVLGPPLALFSNDGPGSSSPSSRTTGWLSWTTGAGARGMLIGRGALVGFSTQSSTSSSSLLRERWRFGERLRLRDRSGEESCRRLCLLLRWLLLFFDSECRGCFFSLRRRRSSSEEESVGEGERRRLPCFLDDRCRSSSESSLRRGSGLFGHMLIDMAARWARRLSSQPEPPPP